MTAAHNIDCPFLGLNDEQKKSLSLVEVGLMDQETNTSKETLEVIYKCELIDLAILKAPKSRFRRLVLNTKLPAPYTKAYTVQLYGVPPTIYAGRILPNDPKSFYQFVDAPIKAEFSGGPLLDVNGTVLGMITRYQPPPVPRGTFLSMRAIIQILQILDNGKIDYLKWGIKAVVHGSKSIFALTPVLVPPARPPQRILHGTHASEVPLSSVARSTLMQLAADKSIPIPMIEVSVRDRARGADKSIPIPLIEVSVRDRARGSDWRSGGNSNYSSSDRTLPDVLLPRPQVKRSMRYGKRTGTNAEKHKPGS
jgi:hypothetical protein